jgi:colanic acid/amylovoran biosynthesis glycosyltransferase
VILMLFTATYPYAEGAEQNFLHMELPYLVERFEKVILVPERQETEQPEPELGRAEVETGYSNYLHRYGPLSVFLAGLRSELAVAELRQRPGLLLKPVHIKRLLFFAGYAELTRSWVLKCVEQHGFQIRDIMFYTYWFDQAAAGLGLLRHDMPEVRVVSRAHGYDVYEDRRSPAYWPCRSAVLRQMDFVYPDSEAGTQYLLSRYPDSDSRIRTARLGAPDPGVLTHASTDGCYRLVSCSRLLPVKRVDLLLEGIRAAAERRPDRKFIWHHFGTGPLLADLQAASATLPPNLEANFAGYSGQAELFTFYRDNPVDAFLNVSSSEGTPVAVIEAMSCGIPILATAVGGNREVASESNGALLPANPSPEEIAIQLLACLEYPAGKRNGSRQLWHEKYDASRNFSSFAAELARIRS